ncbi:PEGA domain-containing protein [Candidatus Woesearchaeota archaeon]|nr:PEGA domain-containing protein [Candidatus Woesearchaeota archaeon]
MNGIKIICTLIALSFVIFGCASPDTVQNEVQEDIVDTGAISVESSPSNAQVYVDGELKGETPSNLYNIPTGSHRITIRKEGYEDFQKDVMVKVGATQEIEAVLNQQAKPSDKKGEKLAENQKEPQQAAEQLESIDISKEFFMYYDFENRLFTTGTTAFQDIFSNKYDTYVYFTAISPSTMLVVNKQVKDANKGDCMNVLDTIANLYSGQSLCVKTVEGNVFALGGSWEASPTKLEWKKIS